MTKRIEITPPPEPLEAYAKHFDAFLEKSHQREGFGRSVEGLLLPSERHKTLTGLVNTEPLVGAQLPRAQKVQAVRIKLLREDLSTAPTERGVLVIDEAADRKHGHQTTHVSRH